MEQVIKIEGGHQLEGEVTISGAKNATVALIPAAVLANGPVTIVGIPQIADVNNLCEILNILNIEVTKVADDHLIIDPTNMKNTDLVQDAVTKLRASYYFMGALLGKYGHVRMKMPGGCYLGPRPIDLHIKGFEALGAEVKFEKGCYDITAKELIGTKIFLDIASVGATINIMMAAVYAKGRTTIENAAKEPEIIPDRIEAGTFIVIAAACAKKMRINNVIPQHLESLLSKLDEMGVNMHVGIDYVEVEESKDLKGTDVTTKPYPGFATDLQQPLTVLMTQAKGESKVEDTIYPERFKHCYELTKMGANIEVRNGEADIEGPTPLGGTEVVATDLRCGAAMVVAGLIADGVTTISDIYHIDRGYSELDKKLTALGANIWREDKQ